MTDDRWGQYQPWFLRYQNHSGGGDFSVFFERLCQRLQRLFLFNETGITNLTHFGAWLESESFQRFKFNKDAPLADQIEGFFKYETVLKEARALFDNDKEQKLVSILQSRQIIQQLGNTIKQYGIKPPSTKQLELSEENLSKEIEKAKRTAKSTENVRFQRHYRFIISQRLTVIEALLQILPYGSGWSQRLIQDIRRYFAEAKIALDLRGNPPLVVPLDEPLLQSEVIDQTFTRLGAKFPERAKELLNAYHDLIAGKNLDSVFSEAFKTLEELARSLTGQKSFMFKKEHLKKHFPKLHPTIHETITKLSAHRGDEAGHGRAAPDPYEIRYLLFTICNIALLLLDYPSQ